MAWIRLDDQFADHPKFMDISEEFADAATALWVRALGYCNRHETDGAIPRGAIRALSHSRKPEAVAAELVRVGLWEATDRGWSVHDYHVYQPRSARTLATSKERSAAGKKAADTRWSRVRAGMKLDANSHPGPCEPHGPPQASPHTEPMRTDATGMPPDPDPDPDPEVEPALEDQDVCRGRGGSGSSPPPNAQAWALEPGTNAQRRAQPSKLDLAVEQLTDAERSVLAVIEADPSLAPICKTPRRLTRDLMAAAPGVDVRIEVLRAGGWLRANPTRKKRNGNRFLLDWMGRSQDRAGPTRHARPQQLEPQRDEPRNWNIGTPRTDHTDEEMADV